MIYVFICSYFFMLFYFFLQKRNVDMFTISFVGISFYFLPGFFGEVGYLSPSYGWLFFDILDETYLFMSAICVTIVIAARFFDYYTKNIEVNTIQGYSSIYCLLLSVLSILSFVLLYYTTNGGFITHDKSEVMDVLNRWHIVFYVSAIMGLCVSVSARFKFYIFIFSMLLFINLIIGFRSPVVIALLSAMVIYFRGSKVKLSEYYKLVSCVIVFAFFMFLYKYVAYALKSGNYELVFERIYDSATYYNMIKMSEPFLILNTLNEIIRQNFTTDSTHIYSSLYGLIIFSPELGAEIISFNDYFQSALFSDVGYGMASSFWGQFWSVYGGSGVFISIFIYTLALMFFNFLYFRLTITGFALLSSSFVYFSFYIHRNDLNYAINISKRIFFLYLFLAVIVYFLPKSRKHHA